MQGVVHDLDKFNLHTWHVYAKWLAGNGSDVWAEYAKHHHSQPHHWEFWNGKEIPKRYLLEMAADWRVAAGDRDPREWFWKRRSSMKLHPEADLWMRANL